MAGSLFNPLSPALTLRGDGWQVGRTFRTPMRDLLIRYLLGELDGNEQQQLEERLQESPELQRELAHLQDCFAAAQNDNLDEVAAPRGLAERTAGRISDSVYGETAPEHESPAPSSETQSVEPASAAPQWSLADFTVAAGVCLAVSMLILPALRDSRDAGRRRVCANNLRETGVYLAIYATENGGYYPRIGPHENAGLYVQRLIERGIVAPEEMAARRLCPGSPWAEKLRGKQLVWQLPPPSEAQAMTPVDLATIKKQMSPAYAYRLPFRVGMRYAYIPDLRSPYIAVMADAPSHSTDDFMPENHDCYFVQVLFQDNHVGTQKRCIASDDDDHLFKNDLGIPAAGCDRGDTVLGRSEATPAIIAIGR